MVIHQSHVVTLQRGGAAGHVEGIHRLARLLTGLADVAKAVREGEDEAVLGMLDDLIERGVKVATDVANGHAKAEAERMAEQVELSNEIIAEVIAEERANEARA